MRVAEPGGEENATPPPTRGWHFIAQSLRVVRGFESPHVST